MNQVTVKLVGCINHTPAKNNQSKLVNSFRGVDERVGNVEINLDNPDKPVLITKTGKYPLAKDVTLNIWATVKTTRKVHVVLNKISGKIIYWA
jgi:hypothetical protein